MYTDFYQTTTAHIIDFLNVPTPPFSYTFDMYDDISETGVWNVGGRYGW